MRLPELLERAHHGTATLITRRGRPYAAVVPATAAHPIGRRVSVLSLRGSGRALWGTKSARTIRAMRDEWS
jgi:antitoxin (DNA-binding transcriptional repressor) of toxin-antitoxin stability system